MRIHDGAYGTLLAGTLHGDETADDLCLRAPAIVVDAHRAYLRAGAHAIQTNAFLAHLRSSERRRRELQRAALACACEAAADVDGVPDGTPVLVLATIGPSGSEPRDFWDDLETVLEAGARAVICETVTQRGIADAFLAAWQDVAAGVDDVEVLLGCSIDPSRDAAHTRWVHELASEAPLNVQVGLNCCEGPDGLRPHLEALCELRGKAWTMPSAGVPTTGEDGEQRWPIDSPAAWAQHASQLVEGLPITALGGCCGTTPSVIAALVER